MEGHPEAVEAHPEAVEAHPGAIEAYPGAVEAHPGAKEAHPGANEVILELLSLQKQNIGIGSKIIESKTKRKTSVRY